MLVPIVFSCPRCFHRYRVKESMAGRTLRCRQCDGIISVPGAVGRFARVPRPIAVTEAVRRNLLRLRLLSRTGFDATGERTLPNPVLAVEVVRDVEQALSCLFPDDVLAVFANADGYLGEHGFRIESVAEQTRDAHRRSCLRDLITVGETDGHVFYCVPSHGALDQCPNLVIYDDEDSSTTVRYLADWLAERVDGRRQFLERQSSVLARREPTDKELTTFRPALVAGWLS
jgi:hypothetical protein